MGLWTVGLLSQIIANAEIPYNNTLLTEFNRIQSQADCCVALQGAWIGAVPHCLVRKATSESHKKKKKTKIYGVHKLKNPQLRENKQC